jgi:hypothetical protein
MPVGTCECCDRTRVAVKHREDMTICYECQGDIPDPYCELEEESANYIVSGLVREAQSLEALQGHINYTNLPSLEEVRGRLDTLISTLKAMRS